MERSETQRMLNTPVTETLKKESLGVVQFREPSLEDLQVIGSDIMLLVGKLQKQFQVADKSEIVGLLIKNPDLMIAAKNLLAVMSGKQASDFDGMPPSDWLRCIVAMKNVVDWQEMRELFFQIVPKTSSSKLAKLLNQLEDGDREQKIREKDDSQQ